MILLRKANINDIEILRHWDTLQHVFESDPNDEWNWEVELQREPVWREQLLAEIEGMPIGIIQIIDPAEEESRYWGNIGHNKRAIDIWIGEVKNLGKGYGTKMMSQVLERCFSDSLVEEVIVDRLESNKKAIHFYKKLGFIFIEKQLFDKDECEVYAITRRKWENFSR